MWGIKDSPRYQILTASCWQNKKNIIHCTGGVSSVQYGSCAPAGYSGHCCAHKTACQCRVWPNDGINTLARGVEPGVQAATSSSIEARAEGVEQPGAGEGGPECAGRACTLRKRERAIIMCAVQKKQHTLMFYWKQWWLMFHVDF